MNPSQVFGIAVRVVGVLLWPVAGWQAYLALYVLAGRTSWVDTMGHAGYDHLLPAICLTVGGIALIRGADAIARFAYPAAKTIQHPEETHVAEWAAR